MSSTTLALLGGAAIGMSAGAALVPLTRRQLAGAVARADADAVEAAPRVATWHLLVMVLASGLLPAIVLHAVGWSIVAVPPLLLLLGLIQLGYCDATKRLLPKNLVWIITAAVIGSGAVIAATQHEWERLFVASIGGIAFFAVLLTMNLLNPKWMAFGDVRLSLVTGFGLAWISMVAVVEGFFIANALAAVIGLGLIAARRAGRRTVLPFGFYLAIGAAITILAWT